MKSIAIGLVTVTAMVVFLGACCGGGTQVQAQPATVTTTTTGEQLTDLQKAYESGAITKEEYDKMRQNIIDKSPK